MDTNGGEVEDQLAALHGAAHRIAVRHVTGDLLDVEPSQVAEVLAGEMQRADLMAVLEQGADDVRSDETCRSRDERFHVSVCARPK